MLSSVISQIDHYQKTHCKQNNNNHEAHITKYYVQYTTNDDKRHFNFMYGCYWEPKLNDQNWWGNKMYPQKREWHLCPLHYPVQYNRCMAVKQWMQWFYTHPPFFTQLGSPWLELTSANLVPLMAVFFSQEEVSSTNLKHMKWFSHSLTQTHKHIQPLPNSIHHSPRYSSKR